jgi:hypothetical protein
VSYMHSSSLPLVLHGLLISSSLTWSFWLYLEKSTSYEASNIILNTLFSNTLSLCSSLKVRDQVRPRRSWSG